MDKYLTMKKIILILSMALVAFSGCKKEECETLNMGTIDVLNTKNSTYMIYINNVYKGDLPPDNSYKFDVMEANGVQVKAEQKNNVIITPIIKEYNVNVIACSDYNVVIE